jgi:DNA repair protein RadC
MRKRYLAGGLEPFADHEALELLLYYAIPRRDVNPIAHALMERYGSLSAVLSAPVEDLKHVEGIGESAAVLLSLAAQITKKAKLAEAGRETVLSTAERAGDFLLERFAGEQHEVVYQLCLDRKGKLLVCKCLGTGDATSVLLDIRRIVENALLSDASSVILSHNHPSGLALPSTDDFAVTDKARLALSAIGVDLLDHIIVADNDFVSMAESGYLT